MKSFTRSWNRSLTWAFGAALLVACAQGTALDELGYVDDPLPEGGSGGGGGSPGGLSGSPGSSGTSPGGSGSPGNGGTPGTGGTPGGGGTPGTAGRAGSGGGTAGSGTAGSGPVGACDWAAAQTACASSNCTSGCPTNDGGYCKTACETLIACVSDTSKCTPTTADPLCAARNGAQTSACTQAAESVGATNSPPAQPGAAALAYVGCACGG